MNQLKRTILPILLAAIWISISEFIRNSYLLQEFWINHYKNLGLIFPEAPVNGAIWGIWSICFAILLYIISCRFTLKQTAVISWSFGFLLMWLVIGNMGTLPLGILIAAVPLSILESIVAAYIIVRFQKKWNAKTYSNFTKMIDIDNG
jgi:hypothetical protein